MNLVAVFALLVSVQNKVQNKGAEAGIGRVENKPHQFVVWRQQNMSLI
jgi:hypothetical protein